MSKFIGAALVLYGVCVSVPSAQAQCGSVVVGKPVYGASVVHHVPTVVKEIVTVAEPVYVPVIVPALSYQYVPPVAAAPVGHAPVAAAPVGHAGVAAAAPGAYPAAPAGPITTPPAAPVHAAPGATLSNDQIKLIAQAVIAEMQKQAAEGGDTGPPPIPGLAPTSAPAPAPTGTGNPGGYPAAPVAPPPVAPGGNGAPPPAAAGGRPRPDSPLAVNAIAALSKNCASCHTGAGSRGDSIVFSQPGILNPEAPFKTIAKEIESGRMPPRSSQFRMTQEEYSTITAWLSGQ